MNAIMIGDWGVQNRTLNLQDLSHKFCSSCAMFHLRGDHQNFSCIVITYLHNPLCSKMSTEPLGTIFSSAGLGLNRQLQTFWNFLHMYIFNFYILLLFRNLFFFFLQPDQSLIPETGGRPDRGFEEEIWWTAGIWCLWYLMVCAWVQSGHVVV